MTTIQNMEQPSAEEAKVIEKRNRKRTGNILGGIIIVIVGSLLLAKKTGVEFPEWLFTWQMLVITVGFYSGVKNNFRDWGWIPVMGVGVIFLLRDYAENFSMYYAWPVLIIVVGLCMILYPGKKENYFR